MGSQKNGPRRGRGRIVRLPDPLARFQGGNVSILTGPGKEKKLLSAYKKFSRKKDVDMLMLTKFDPNNDSSLVITEKEWYEGDKSIPDKIKWTEGTHRCYIDDHPSLVVIRRVIEPGPLPFEDVAGEMMIAYQDFLESEWIKQLKADYTVKVDELVFQEIKKEAGE